MLKRIISSADFIGYRENLKINSKSRLQTTFGGILSLSIVISFAMMVVYLGREIFNKSEPLLIESVNVDDTVGPFKISPDVLEIFISLGDISFLNYRDDRIYTVSAKKIHVYYTNNETEAVTQVTDEGDVEIISCADKYTSEKLEEMGIIMDPRQFHCIKSEEISGFWGAYDYKSIYITIEKCNNSTNPNKNCRPIEEIDEVLSRGSLQMFYTDYLLYPKNYTHPLKMYLKDKVYTIGSRNQIDFFTQYRSMSLVTDNGFLLPNFEEEKVTAIADMFFSYTFNEDEIISTILLEGYQYGKKYDRSYMKIQDVITKLGGLYKGLLILAMIVNYFPSRSYYYSLSFEKFHYDTTRKDLPKLETLKNLNLMNSLKRNMKEGNINHNKRRLSMEPIRLASNKNILYNEFNDNSKISMIKEESKPNDISDFKEMDIKKESIFINSNTNFENNSPEKLKILSKLANNSSNDISHSRDTIRKNTIKRADDYFINTYNVPENNPSILNIRKTIQKNDIDFKIQPLNSELNKIYEEDMNINHFPDKKNLYPSQIEINNSCDIINNFSFSYPVKEEDIKRSKTPDLDAEEISKEKISKENYLKFFKSFKTNKTNFSNLNCKQKIRRIFMYWFPKCDKKKSSLILEKERFMNNSLSSETITKMNYYVETMKLVLFDSVSLLTLDDSYNHLFTNKNLQIATIKNRLLDPSLTDDLGESQDKCIDKKLELLNRINEERLE